VVEKVDKAKVENLIKEAAGLFKHHQHHVLQANNITTCSSVLEMLQFPQVIKFPVF